MGGPTMADDPAHTPGVFISGLGPVTALGFGIDELVSSMTARTLTAESGPRRTEPAEPLLVRDFELGDFIDSQRPYLDPQARCALAAAALAMENAGVQTDEVDPGRCGLCFATVLGSMDTLATFQKLVDERGIRLASPVLFGHTYPNTTAGMLSIEFALRGYHQNLCGDLLCGAQALEAALLALRGGRADMVLAGGADVVSRSTLERLGRDGSPWDVPPAQGAALLLLETSEAVERREGFFNYGELGSVVCLGTDGETSAEGLAEVLRDAIGIAMDEAGIWEGDVGIVFVAGSDPVRKRTGQAIDLALNIFSEVPVESARRFVGETFGAGFPLECTAAAAALSMGTVPPKVTFVDKSKGVEFWVERRPEPLMGHAALVVGCTAQTAAAAVLRGF